MRILKYLLYIAVFLYFVGFSLINNQKIAIKLPFSEGVIQAYFFVFIYLALMLGIFIGYLFASKRIIEGWSAKREKEKENKKLKEKVDIYETELKIYDNIRESNKQLRLSNISKLLLPRK